MNPHDVQRRDAQGFLQQPLEAPAALLFNSRGNQPAAVSGGAMPARQLAQPMASRSCLGTGQFSGQADPCGTSGGGCGPPAPLGDKSLNVSKETEQAFSSVS